jgi:hypothetical protein
MARVVILPDARGRVPVPSRSRRMADPGIVQHAYDDMGHFCLSDMNTDQFPDLLRAIAG